MRWAIVGRVATRGAPLKPRLKVWILFDDRVEFGDGRAHVLERIEARARGPAGRAPVGRPPGSDAPRPCTASLLKASRR